MIINVWRKRAAAWEELRGPSLGCNLMSDKFFPDEIAGRHERGCVVSAEKLSRQSREGHGMAVESSWSGGLRRQERRRMQPLHAFSGMSFAEFRFRAGAQDRTNVVTANFEPEQDPRGDPQR